MICGSGMLAKYFSKINNKDVLFFCSGVSDCKSFDFDREKKCLLSFSKNQFIVYSSSLSASLKKTKYQNHKLSMENIIVDYYKNYLIFRIGNLVGHSQNQNQFFPNIVNQIKNKKVLIHNFHRDLLLCSDYVNIVKSMLNSKNKILSLCSQSPPHVSLIVHEIEKYLGTSYKVFSNLQEPNLPTIPDVITGDKNYYKKVIQSYFFRKL